VWGEKNDSSLFAFFCEHCILAGFVTALRVHGCPKVVKLQVLQSLSILIQNAQRTTSLIYLLSGGLLNTFFDCPPELEDEEVLAYFITLLKGLVMRLDEELSLLCLVKLDASFAGADQHSSEFAHALWRMPVFERSVYLIGHNDTMVKTAARTAVLYVLRLNQPLVRTAAEEASLRLMVPCLANLASANSSGTSSDDSDALAEDLMGFVSDICRLNISTINSALESCGFAIDSSGSAIVCPRAEEH